MYVCACMILTAENELQYIWEGTNACETDYGLYIGNTCLWKRSAINWKQQSGILNHLFVLYKTDDTCLVLFKVGIFFVFK
jgi:hypothetical protein